VDILDVFTQPQAWISLLTLTALEIVLGVDNLVFVAVATQGLPAGQQARAARLGLALAVVFRLALLSAMFWLVHLNRPLLTVYGQSLSGRDIILVLGGLFLLFKATEEIHEEIDIDDEDEHTGKPRSFWRAIAMIALLDIVFSIDSVLTAIGMADHLEVMILAVLIAVGIMIWAAAPVSRFVEQHPTVKMLALSFLLLIGMTLLADGFGYHIPKGFIYAAISFSLLVEGLNQWAGRNRVRARRERIRASRGPDARREPGGDARREPREDARREPREETRLEPEEE
jgi:predicted tellurium resistance membrane protein TerC